MGTLGEDDPGVGGQVILKVGGPALRQRSSCLTSSASLSAPLPDLPWRAAHAGRV